MERSVQAAVKRCISSNGDRVLRRARTPISKLVMSEERRPLKFRNWLKRSNPVGATTSEFRRPIQEVQRLPESINRSPQPHLRIMLPWGTHTHRALGPVHTLNPPACDRLTLIRHF